MEAAGKRYICTKCLRSLPLTSQYFRPDIRYATGFRTHCRSCRAARARELHKEHPEKMRMAWAKYRAAHLEERRKEDREYKKRWRKEHPEEERIRRLAAAPCKEAWRKAHPEKCRASSLRTARRWRQNPKNRLSSNMARRMYAAFKCGKEGRHWGEFLPYSLRDLATHLEAQFSDTMSWENYGEWHVHHRVPVAAFSFSQHTDPEFRECWALSNLQPLWAIENFKQGARRDN